MKRFPSFEHSYETTPHKNIRECYNVCLAIPQSKKFYAWFTFYENRNVCFIVELTREKKVGTIRLSAVQMVDERLCLGTLVYGSLIPASKDDPSLQYFLIEDIFYYKGVPLSKSKFSEKLGYIQRILEKDVLSIHEQVNNEAAISIVFRLPVIWSVLVSRDTTGSNQDIELFSIPDPAKALITYNIHHIQYRSLNTIAPFLNVVSHGPKPPPKSMVSNGNAEAVRKSIPIIETKYAGNFHKSQYDMRTVFSVKADIQYDMYRLYAYQSPKNMVYCDLAYIPNCKTSVFMNSLFRNIKENSNLDFIEESDDEEDFQDMRYDKYVDLEKTVNIECVFSRKFRRWIPVQVARPGMPIVHISKLVGA